MIDVTQQINSVRRQLGRRQLEAGEAVVATITQTYATDPEDLWEAVTDPDRIRRWFLPVSGDLQVGGRYQLEGNAAGTVESCDRPKGFTATWEFGGGISWIEVRISPADDGKALFELDHIAHIDETMWPQFGPGAVGIGWDMGFLGLALHVAGGDKFEEGEFEVTDDGKLFIRLSAERWREADTSFGTDPEQAAASAERSRQFYTGELPPPDFSGEGGSGQQ
ncbi:SRPBCC family protein [Pseudonocardia sp. TRM90224]|uniref:SRPBCC family protein n=1 Tax=Pseudonocardia sp. TRM90224 TaxID=2812678 RepID=UPI001E39921E|nr:SRPBCC family protein [Pseudonocardia sp. TRM90224]